MHRKKLSNLGKVVNTAENPVNANRLRFSGGRRRNKEIVWTVNRFVEATVGQNYTW